MESMGLIERTHGGALLPENSEEISIFFRMEKNAREKEKAAEQAQQDTAVTSEPFDPNAPTPDDLIPPTIEDAPDIADAPKIEDAPKVGTPDDTDEK